MRTPAAPRAEFKTVRLCISYWSIPVRVTVPLRTVTVTLDWDPSPALVSLWVTFFTIDLSGTRSL